MKGPRRAVGRERSPRRDIGGSSAWVYVEGLGERDYRDRGVVMGWWRPAGEVGRVGRIDRINLALRAGRRGGKRRGAGWRGA